MSVVYLRKYTCRLLAILAVGFAFASTWTLAEMSARDEIISHQQSGNPKDVSLRQEHEDGAPPVQLPRPINEMTGGSSAKAGLVGGGIGLSQTGGSAIVAPRGGSMMSPAERADQGIRTVIRRLG